MEMAMIGLGRMGGNMVSRLLKAGHRMIAYDQSPAAVEGKVDEGAVGASNLAEVAAAFTAKPRILWGGGRGRREQPRRGGVGFHREAADRVGDGARRRPDDADDQGALRSAGAGRHRH